MLNLYEKLDASTIPELELGTYYLLYDLLDDPRKMFLDALTDSDHYEYLVAAISIATTSLGKRIAFAANPDNRCPLCNHQLESIGQCPKCGQMVGDADSEKLVLKLITEGDDEK